MVLASAIRGPSWGCQFRAGWSVGRLERVGIAGWAGRRTAGDAVVTGGGQGRVHDGDAAITSRQNRAMELCETVTPVSRKILAMVRYEACLRRNSAMLSWNGKSLPNRLDALGE
jgi:predicted NAD/FAD-binding protein